jgi:hypothetical protein
MPSKEVWAIQWAKGAIRGAQPRIMPRLGIIAPEFLEGSTLSRFKMNGNMTEILTTW